MNKTQSVSIFVLRVLIGWHFLYEGLVKISDPSWSSVGYLKSSQGPFSGIFIALADQSTTMVAIDFLNQWGLIVIGLALITGIFTRIFAFSGMVLLLLYYLCVPPWVGLEYSIPMEGKYLIVNKTLIEAAALFVLGVFSAGEQFGLDTLIKRKSAAATNLATG